MPHISDELEKRYLGLLLDHLADRFESCTKVNRFDLIEVDGTEVEAEDLLRAIRLHEPL